MLNILSSSWLEKNEVLDGTHWRELPMPDEAGAARKFDELVEEARRWKGAPVREHRATRRLAAWPDLEIRQAGPGIRVRARAPWFDWWHADKTWQGDPMGPIYDWFDEEEEARKKPSLKEHLLAIPEVGEDKDLERG